MCVKCYILLSIVSSEAELLLSVSSNVDLLSSVSDDAGLLLKLCQCFNS